MAGNMRDPRIDAVIPARIKQLRPSQYFFANFEELPVADFQTSRMFSVLDADVIPITATLKSTIVIKTVSEWEEVDWIIPFAGVANPWVAVIVLMGEEEVFPSEECQRTFLAHSPYSRLVVISIQQPSDLSTDYFWDLLDEGYRVDIIMYQFALKLCPEKGHATLTFLPKCNLGEKVGAILVQDEDVITHHIHATRQKYRRNFKRRLYFKRAAPVIQTEVDSILPLAPTDRTRKELRVLMEQGKIRFVPETWHLSSIYLIHMVKSFSKISPYLDSRIQNGFRPRVLVLGVGGGALVSFLNSRFHFEIIGVEIDSIVVSVAKFHFGLENGKYVRLIIGDALKLIRVLALGEKKGFIRLPREYREMEGRKMIVVKNFEPKFDAIMVDLNSVDGRIPVTSPPSEFVKKSMFRDLRVILRKEGILIINVFPPGKQWSDNLVRKAKKIFPEVRKTFTSESNEVITALCTPTEAAEMYHAENSFSEKLESVFSHLEH